MESDAHVDWFFIEIFLKDFNVVNQSFYVR